MSDYIILKTEEQFYSLLNKAITFYFQNGNPFNGFVYKITKNVAGLCAQCIDFDSAKMYGNIYFDLTTGYAIFPPSILSKKQKEAIFDIIFNYGVR